MMSTLFSALIAIIAIVNAQYDDDCGTTTVTVNGVDLMMQLERDSTNEMVRITLTGPSDQWFGFIIGQGTMPGGYAITGQGSSYELVERKLAKQQNPLGGSTLTSSGTATATLNGNGVLVLERPYAAPDSDYFDFTDLMTCQVESIDIAAARGTSLTFAQHTSNNRVRLQTYTSQCCTDAPSKTPSSSPSASPAQASDTSEPSVSPVTSQPSTSPVTSIPTSSPEEAASDYVICGEAELITDVSLTVYRDAENEMVKIEVSGPPTYWWGYGFGTSVMTGAYAVTVRGADEDNLSVGQYVLDKASPPGVSKDYGTSTITTTDTVATGVVTMGYAAADYDFTDFLTCQSDSIPLIAARGDGTSISGGHSERVSGMTLERASTCTCDSTPGGDDAANSIFNGFYVVIGLVIGLLFV